MTYPLASPVKAGLMSPAHAQFVEAGQLFCGTAGGTASALTVSTGKNLTGLMVNQVIGLKVGASANPGASTLNVDGLGAKAIQKNGAALVGGELAASTDLWFQYDGSNWRLLGGAGGSVAFPTLAKSSAYTVTPADVGKLILCSGTFNPTLPAATVGNGWSVAVANAGAGTINVIGSGSDTVNALSRSLLLPGDAALYVSDGVSNWTPIGQTTRSVEYWNPSDKGTNIALSNFNLTASGSISASTSAVRGVIPIPVTGKCYWEVVLDVRGVDSSTGIATSAASLSNYIGQQASSYGYSSPGNFLNNATAATTGSVQASGGVIGHFFDVSAGKLWWSYNGVVQGGGNPASGTSPTFTVSAGTYYPAFSIGGGGSGSTQVTARFTATSWQYSSLGFSAII
ncbi:SPRY domain-containing protein [Azospirillum melinis]|uniref:SPRY domain-containing protein n=1 Tax=Azospirillum melinis TaxID=328839 RepID=UPI0037576E30